MCYDVYISHTVYQYTMSLPSCATQNDGKTNAMICLSFISASQLHLSFQNQSETWVVFYHERREREERRKKESVILSP